MGLYGNNVRKIILELDVPTADDADYDIPDEGEEDAPASKNVTTGNDDEGDYDLPPEDEEDPEEDDEAGDYDLPEDEEDVDPEEDPGDEEDLPEDDEDTGDYDLPEDEEDTGDEETTDDTETDGEETTEEEIPEEDDELFVDLTDAQKAIRDKSLFKLYSELYAMTSEFSIKLDKVSRNGNNMVYLDFTTDKIKELTDVLYDYIIYTYPTKNYTENYANYYEFIASFNQINKMLEDMANNKEKEDKK